MTAACCCSYKRARRKVRSVSCTTTTESAAKRTAHVRRPRRDAGRDHHRDFRLHQADRTRRTLWHHDRVARHGVDPRIGLGPERCRREGRHGTDGDNRPREMALGIRFARRAVHPLVRRRRFAVYQHDDLRRGDNGRRNPVRIHPLRRLFHVVDRGGVRPAQNHQTPDRLALRGDGLRLSLRPGDALPVHRRRHGIRPGRRMPEFLRILRAIRGPEL